MHDRTAGYVADVPYSYGYYRELNPLQARLALLNAGLAPPEQACHCELGFGQGLSANIHAAASASAWYGNDFNPAQAGFARSLAKASGADARLSDEAFADFCHRPDLPSFDSISLHGVWSWISDSNRALITDFVRRKLKLGGVLYVSYNTQAGWVTMLPLRDLLTEHAAATGTAGHATLARIDAAIAFAEKLFATTPLYAIANPLAVERLKAIKGQRRDYLAHEYFNRDWSPMPFSKMAQWLAPAGLAFACSAHCLDAIDALNLSAEQQRLLQEIPDTVFRETVRDLIVNQHFRCDYWVKGAKRLKPLEQEKALRSHRLMLVSPRAAVSLTFHGARGEVTMNDAVYQPMLDLLATHQAMTLGELEQGVVGKGISFAQLTQAVLFLTGTGHVLAVQDEATMIQARKYTQALNAHLIDRAQGNDEIGHLASPVTGGGVKVTRLQRLFLLARSQGRTDATDWAQFAWQTIAPQTRLAELTAQANDFAELQLPILQALQIA